MKPPPQIRNTSITLYPFHLRNDGDEGYQQAAQNAENLWQNLADNVGKNSIFPNSNPSETISSATKMESITQRAKMPTLAIKNC